MWLIVYSNDHAPLTIRPIYSSSKLRTAQMMIFSLVAMIGLEKMLHNICMSAVAMSLRWANRGPWASCYFIVSGEISVYLVKIKVVSITSELISYHFTSDWYNLYFHCSLWTTSVFFIVSEVDVTSTSDFWTPLTSLFLNRQVLVCIFLVRM